MTDVAGEVMDEITEKAQELRREVDQLLAQHKEARTMARYATQYALNKDAEIADLEARLARSEADRKAIYKTMQKEVAGRFRAETVLEQVRDCLPDISPDEHREVVTVKTVRSLLEEYADPDWEPGFAPVEPKAGGIEDVHLPEVNDAIEDATD